jgi:hypothetical protein
LWIDVDHDGLIDGSESQTILAGGTTLSLTSTSGTMTVIPDCTNLQFAVDAAAPSTRRICISFDLLENGETRHYEINGSLWASDGHLH